LICGISLGAASPFAFGLRAAADTTQALDERRAVESYGVMQRYFYVAATSSYDGTYPASGQGHAQLWPYSQALEATLESARLPGRAGAGALALLPRTLARLAAYRAPLAGRLAYAPLYGGKGNVFYDDNDWIGIDLVGAAILLNDRASLSAAQQVFTLIQTGWDSRASTCRGGVYWLMPGGTYWNRSPLNRYRAAVSTANAALLGVLLYEQTQDRYDLLWATRAYSWTERCLGSENGLISDHIDTDGKVTAAIASYNQGAMIATALGLYRITHQRRYLNAALRTVDASLSAFRDPLSQGDPAPFLAIFYHDLLPLLSSGHRDAIRNAITSFADRVWSEKRDPTTGLFHFGHTSATLLDQAAMVQIYAELAET